MNKEFQSLITSHQKVLFIFDFDGTMLEAKYGSRTILGCSDNNIDVLKRDLEYCVYDGVKPLKRVQNIVKSIHLNNKTVKVLTKIENGIEVLNKMKYLYRNYPEIKVGDLIGVINYEHKEVVLRHYATKYDMVVYIDDYLDFLIQLEDNFNDIDNIKCFHVSSLFIDNE